MSQPDLSVIVPVYNRGDLIRYTMESIRRAAPGLDVETIVVDDGSRTPAADDIARLGYADMVRVIRQANAGLLFARLAGLDAANGRYTLFLDSDDLVAPSKFRAQLHAMKAAGADVSYSDTGHCHLEGDYDSLRITPGESAPVTTNCAEFFVNVQPPPHSPIFRTEFVREVTAQAFFPPSPLYNPVAEIWFYHNAAPRAARVLHVPGWLTIVGSHSTSRLTNEWERLAVASLAVMEAFARAVPATLEQAFARRLVGEKAFRSWRRLPRGFHPAFERRLLALWATLSPSCDSTALGGRLFRAAATPLGPIGAGKLFRRWQNRPYASIRTLSPEKFAELLAAVPAPDLQSAHV